MSLADELNSILQDWKTKFDLFSETQLEFTVNESGYLCLNGLSLYPAKKLELQGAEYNISQILYFFNTGGDSITIHMKWPEDRSPKLESVFVELSNGEVPVFYGV